MQKIKVTVLGFISGILNGLFGAGGGVLVVPMLEQLDLPPQKSHATSIAIILPLSIATTISYSISRVPTHFTELFWLVPFGLVGAFLGAKLLCKIKDTVLTKIFALIIIYSGIRMLF